MNRPAAILAATLALTITSATPAHALYVERETSDRCDWSALLGDVHIWMRVTWHETSRFVRVVEQVES